MQSGPPGGDRRDAEESCRCAVPSSFGRVAADGRLRPLPKARVKTVDSWRHSLGSHRQVHDQLTEQGSVKLSSLAPSPPGSDLGLQGRSVSPIWHAAAWSSLGSGCASLPAAGGDRSASPLWHGAYNARVSSQHAARSGQKLASPVQSLSPVRLLTPQWQQAFRSQHVARARSAESLLRRHRRSPSPGPMLPLPANRIFCSVDGGLQTHPGWDHRSSLSTARGSERCRALLEVELLDEDLATGGGSPSQSSTHTRTSKISKASAGRASCDTVSTAYTAGSRTGRAGAWRHAQSFSSSCSWLDKAQTGTEDALGEDASSESDDDWELEFMMRAGMDADDNLDESAFASRT
mmetsp:Transcript_79216/g.232598  ORF Transcript_79216/g.232598 Transcript_79216/m.232598 type:complete len:349 (+) Transcript_79216:63-1109(+)